MVKLAKVVFVAGNAEVAERYCSRMRKAGVYLPVIEGPRLRLVNYGVFDRDCIRVANAVRALRPHSLLFLRVDPQVADKLRACVPEIQPVLVETFDNDLRLAHIKFGRRVEFRDLLAVRSQDYSTNIFAVEGEFGIPHVIAANLAIAHGGRVASIAQVSDDEIDVLKENSRTWSNGSPEEKKQAKEAILDFVRSRLPEGLLSSSSLRSVSFITRGVPYGLVPFRVPATHYFSFPLLGVSVLSGMLKGQAHVRCPVALLIHPNTVGQISFETLRKQFAPAVYLFPLPH